MASESLRGKERRHHSCEFLSGLQESPWRPQVFSLVEAYWIARLANSAGITAFSAPLMMLVFWAFSPSFGDMLPGTVWEMLG